MFWIALTVPAPALIVPLPVNRFPNKLALHVPNNILKNPTFRSSTSFSIVLLKLFINNPYSWSDLTILIISFLSSFEIINFVTPDRNFFLWIVASFPDAAAVNPNGIKALLANGFSIFPIKSNSVFSNGPNSLLKNPPDYLILCNWVYIY